MMCEMKEKRKKGKKENMIWLLMKIILCVCVNYSVNAILCHCYYSLLIRYSDDGKKRVLLQWNEKRNVIKSGMAIWNDK